MVVKSHTTNFPHEGGNMLVTRPYLDQLRSSIRTPNSKLEYTIGGMRETIVHSTVDADRQYRLAKGERILKTASVKLQQNYAFKSIRGHAKAQFKAVSMNQRKAPAHRHANQNSIEKSRNPPKSGALERIHRRAAEIRQEQAGNQRQRTTVRERER